MVDFTAHFVPVVVVVVTVVKAAIADFVVAVTCCSNSCILGDVITIFVPHVAVPIPVDITATFVAAVVSVGLLLEMLQMCLFQLLLLSMLLYLHLLLMLQLISCSRCTSGRC